MKCQPQVLIVVSMALAMAACGARCMAFDLDPPPLPPLDDESALTISSASAHETLPEFVPGLYAVKETLLWGRSAGSRGVAVIHVTNESTSLPGSTLLDADDLPSNFQPGMRIIAGWRPNLEWGWELAYLGIFDWHAAKAAHGHNDLALAGELGTGSQDFFAADEILMTYHSQFNSVEANVIRNSGAFSLLTGFRYLSVYETLNTRSLDLDAGTGRYLISTTNNLFGGQIGARVQRGKNRFAWDSTGKVGLLGNGASEWQFVTDARPTGFLRQRIGDSNAQLAFVGDVNVSANYRLFSFLTLRAGYNLLWLQGVALAPEQLDFGNSSTSGADVHSSGGFFAHGVSAGGLADW